MLKKLIIFTLSLFLVLLQVTAVNAQSPSPVPSTPGEPEKINSFEVFWPLSAGKTIESKVYFLKSFKENARGWLIFGKAQKAKYQVFLGTKRVLEAEALLISGKKDLANATLDLAMDLFKSASENIDKAKESGEIAQDVKDEINTRVSNLKKLLSWLATQYPDNKDKLNDVLEILNNLSSKI